MPAATLANYGRYSGYSVAGSTRYLYGSYHWSGHFSLAFGWGAGCGWGSYGYPYYASCYWPRYYYNCRSSFGGYWGGYGYSSSYCNWWWPRGCYLPGSYFGFSYWPTYCASYTDWYYSPVRSTVIVRDVVASDELAAETEPTEEKPTGETDEKAAAEKAAEDLAKLARQHLNLGDFYFKQGRFEEAAESYMRALAYAPDDGSIHFVIADALFAQGDYHYAAFMIEKGLRLDPDLAKAETDKRTFYGDPSLFDKELETLRRYLVDKPYDAAGHLVLGYNLRFSGDVEGARLAFERVLEVSPGDQPAQLFLGALSADAAAEKGGAADKDKGDTGKASAEPKKDEKKNDEK